MAQVSSTSKAATTDPDTTFIKPFHVKGKQKFDQRMGEIKDSLKELDRAAVVLESAGVPQWKSLAEQSRNLQEFVKIQEDTSKAAEFSFKQAAKSLKGINETADKATKQARALVGPAASKHAQTLLTQLRNDVGNNQFPKAAFDDLDQQFTAISTKTGKTSKDTEDPYVPFIVEATTALKKRDEARTKWQTLDPKTTSADAERLETQARALNLAAIAAKAKGAADGCTQAQTWHADGHFAEACGEVKAANLALAGAQKDFAAQISKLLKASELLQGLRQPAAAKLQFGTARNIGWLVTAAEKVTKGIDAAVALENLGPLQHPASRQAALKVLPDVTALNDAWDKFQHEMEVWLGGEPKLKQNQGLAKAFIAEADDNIKKKNTDYDWAKLKKASENFRTNILPAVNLAAQNKFGDADVASRMPTLLFVTAKKTFRDYREKQCQQKFDGLVQSDPNGPEATLKKFLKPNEITERITDVTNSMASAKQEVGYDIPDTLSIGDAAAVFSYTTQDYEDIQPYLRKRAKLDQQQLTQLLQSDPASARLEALSQLTQSVLKKLPAYAGQPTRRGEKDWPGADQRFQPNNPFTIDDFWSTGVGFAFPGKYQITVHPKGGGKRVAALSQYVHEGEVLYPPGTNFTVTSRTDVSADKVLVEVREV